MKTYANIIDLLNMEGPGLQDYVNLAELDQLIHGTLAPATIADRYIAEFADRVHTDDEATMRDELLSWIRWEIEIAIQQRKEHPDEEQPLARLRAVAAAEARHEKVSLADKMAIIEQARRTSTKDAIARNLGISRPTLDKWINDQKDRALFNDALYLTIKHPGAGSAEFASEALGIRDTAEQARALLSAIRYYDPTPLTAEQMELMARAEKRALEIA